MSAQDDGEPAFPVPNDANVNEQPGMTLRDWFAGQALASVISTPWYADQNKPYSECAAYIAADAYTIADAMLAAREAKQ